MSRIRNLTPADLTALAAISAGQPTSPHSPGNESLFAPEAPERILLGVEEAGALVAFAIVLPVMDEAELENIVVASARQQQGIAQELLTVLIEELRRRGILRLHLEVRPSNLPAHALYRSVGFRVTGSRPGYYSNPLEDALLMTLTIQNKDNLDAIGFFRSL
jgi:ribosomal-protein-alanine N-acetyltransferase